MIVTTPSNERERCGTGSFVRFRTDFPEALGTVSNVLINGVAPTVLGDGVVTTGDDHILWTPRSGPSYPKTRPASWARATSRP